MAQDGGLKQRLRRLYDGSQADAIAFRYGLLAFDVATIAFFLVVTFIEPGPLVLGLEFALGIVLLAELVVRLWLSTRRLSFAVKPVTLADVIVIVSLILPSVFGNLGFFRVLRALRLVHSYHVLGLARRRFSWVRRNQDTITSVLHLVVFVFFISALVFVSQHQANQAITNYVDALYFTVTTLTTTGFGDIILVGGGGRLLAVLIMIFGISLFLHLLHSLFRPAKVHHQCDECGLARHDPDAVHCKHCGALINIPSEGEF